MRQELILLARNYAENLKHFIDNSPTPFHAVSYLTGVLKGKGFRYIAEGDPWVLKSGDRCIVTRNGSSLGAFVVGSRPLSKSGFRIVGAHTDSPNLRLKPKSVYDRVGYVQFAIEPYGGLILASWLNRDLSIAGRVVIRSKDGRLNAKLVKLDRPILSIPQLAIHLDREVNDKGLVLNKQGHLPPIVALASTERSSAERFDMLLRHALRAEMNPGDDIIAMDLALYDTQPSTIGGLDYEFVYAPRLDNLASCHAAIYALSETADTFYTSVVVCYDNEEVGSQTAQGARSPFLKDMLERIACSSSPNKLQTETFKRAVAHSFCISADMAHAVHPNYTDRHDPLHMPVIGGGPVIKSNVNWRYASDSRSMAFFIELCRRADISYQNFVSRSDIVCGSTIGPITAAELGVSTVDVGNPMLSMHSVREQAGVTDHIAMIEVLKKFFDNETADLKVE